MYSRDARLEKVQLAILDVAVVFVSALGATWLRHSSEWTSPLGEPVHVPWNAYLFPAALVSLAFVVLFRYQGLYTVRYGRLIEAFRVVKAASIATMAVLTLTFFYRGYSYSRATALIFYPTSIALLLVSRNLYRAYRAAVHAKREAARRVLIVGFGSVGQHLARALLRDPGYYHLVGFLDDDPIKLGAELAGVRVLGATEDLVRIAGKCEADEVILAIPSASQERIMDLVGECLRLRVRWKVVPNLCDLMLERVHLDHVAGLPLIGLRGSNVVGFNWALKRAFDLAFASAVLVVLSPVLLVVAAAVKLTSRGPVLYRQTRVGLHGRPFPFVKFRTMRTASGAEIHQRFAADWIYGRSGRDVPTRAVGAALAAPPIGEPGVHKIVRDPRVTAVGSFLRRTSLDELPQLLSVLRGTMSVVGPRPPIPYEVERYTEWHKRRLEVLPGITGLWQVSGRNRLTFDEMVRLDVEYIETWSLEQDLKIVLKTVPALLGRAY
jgi:exopolysaccharide biosynthesis polyprenyl glycosylphosphotransferase